MSYKKTLVGEQWDVCDRCGFRFPISQLTYQKGLRVDAKCIDDLTVERRDIEISRILATNETEGADLRYVDTAFFDVQEETTQ